MQQISSTKSPIKAQCIAAWEHENAQAIESALHQLLEDERVEGEWFYDKEDTLEERLQPIMELIGAKKVTIETSNDAYTKSILQKEGEAKLKTDHILLGEISDLLNDPLKATSRKGGPTFYSERKKLTYYVGARKSGNHRLSIGRSKAVYDELTKFLEKRGYDVGQSKKGDAKILGVTVEIIAEVINAIEAEFESSQ